MGAHPLPDRCADISRSSGLSRMFRCRSLRRCERRLTLYLLRLHAVNENGRDVGEPAPRPFRYFDKGNLAVVGKGFAILQSGKIHVKGFPARVAWAAVHLQFLAQSNLRVSVFVQWAWTNLTGQRDTQLVVNHHGSETQRPMADTPHGAVVSSK